MRKIFLVVAGIFLFNGVVIGGDILRPQPAVEKTAPQSSLEEYLRRPEVTGTGGKGIRARFLTMAIGGTRSYDALILDGFPHKMLPELKEGLSPLLYRFEQEAAAAGAGWAWLDLAAGLATAPKEARKRCPHMKPVLVDMVRWARSDLPLEDAVEVEQRAGSIGIRDVWSMEGLDFIQADAGQVEIPKNERYPIRVATMFQALSYNRDPLRILAHVYNQLPVGAYLLVNFYIPTKYDASKVYDDKTKVGLPPEYADPKNLARFWEAVLQNLQANGVPVDFMIKDLREEYTPAQGFADKFFDEIHIGMVIQRAPIEIGLQLTAHAAPVQVIGSRLVEYQFAWYEGELAKPFAYHEGAVSQGAALQDAAKITESSVLRPLAADEGWFVAAKCKFFP